MKNKKGFTLIELLTVIAILAVILLIAAPVILGVLDKARKNTFKNQVLLYVEGLKQQTALAAMGQGYSELQKIDTAFYSPTSDSTGKIVRVSISSLNKIMDNAILTSDTDKYMYVEWSDNGYNYYIGEGVRKEGEYSTTCAYATGKEACEDKVYNNENIKLINSKVLALVHISRNDIVSSNTSGSNSGSVASNAPTLTISESGSYATFEVSDDIAGYCITKVNDSGSCTEFISPEENQTSVTLLGTKGKNYIFLKKSNDEITSGAEFEVAGLPSETFENKNSGDAISLGGYNWHVIGEDDTKIWLLMDAKQLSNMSHCNTGFSSSCTYQSGINVYSWQGSLVRKYLNENFYNNLSDEIKSSLVPTEVCGDPSLNSDTSYSYGGYTKNEIESLSLQGAICNSGYVSDKVRLISQSEYYNLTPYYSTTSYPVASVVGNGKGYIPKVNYISRLSSNNWLYSSSISYWATMCVYSYPNYNYLRRMLSVYGEGYLDTQFSTNGLGVRPVIVLQK